MNGDIEKAAENCRSEILDRIEMQGIDDFDKAYVATDEVISEHVRGFLKFSIDVIEKLVRRKLENQKGVKWPS